MAIDPEGQPFGLEMGIPSWDPQKSNPPSLDSQNFDPQKSNPPSLDSQNFDPQNLDSPESGTPELGTSSLDPPELGTPELDPPELDPPELGTRELGVSGVRRDRPRQSRRASVAPFEFGGQAIAPGRKVRCDLPIAPLPTQTLITLPITIAHGAQPGPCIWLSAAIHGDEINGMEIVRQVVDRLKPHRLRGTVIAVPIVNVFGFIDRSRYLPDRRDLNRSFPGSQRGSMAARLAHLFATRIMDRCSHGIDFHTASDHRENLPHLRANLDDPETRRIMAAFGAPVAIHAAARDGSLRQAAVQRGVCVLVYEAGESLRFNQEAIQIGTEGTLRVLGALGMISNPPPAAEPPPQEFRTTRWIRASRSGILRSAIALGTTVTQGQVIAEIADAFGQRRVKVKAPCTGLMIGIRQNPLVNQGDGIFHLAPASES